MSVLEVKGEIHELIAQIKDRPSAEKLLFIIKEFLQTGKEQEEGDNWEEVMTPEQEQAIRQALERSEDERNYVAETSTQQQLSRWLKP